uniref:SSD domain-containing protein n=1 Tax=Panagrolaimus sp. ES5 TaxID=591445 RepID=A0AC34F554_9BILA
MAQAKLAFTPQRDDIYGYSPYGARARTELQRYEEFFGHTGQDMAIGIFALAKDGGTMLRSNHLKEMIDHGFEIQSTLAENNQPLTPRMNLRYPISKMFGREFSLQNNFFGIDLDNDTVNSSNVVSNSTMLSKNNRAKKHVTNMNYVKMVVLTFRAEHQIGWEDADVKNFEMKVVEFFKKDYHSKNLDIYVLSRTYVEEEVKRAGQSLIPYVAVGFVIMLFCSVLGVVCRAYYLKQHSRSKILLALASCILPLLACGTALALMTTLGFRFSSILCVIPLLVLAIGIDSSYLMIHEWQRIIQQCRDNPSEENGQIGYRIAEVLSEVGPAIMISALTNMLADAVGAFTSSPEITLLCVGNLLSMGVVFIYQMTFYVGLMSLIGKQEIKMEQTKQKEIEAAKNVEAANQVHFTPHNSKPAKKEVTEEISKTMWTYVSLIANKFVAAFIIFLYFAYVLFSVYGITQINIHLSTQKLFPQDSPLLALDKLRIKYQVPHFTMATVFINNPGNFSNPARLQRMNEFVGDMEQLPGGWGPVATKYFVRDFLQFENIDVENLEVANDETTTDIQSNITILPSASEVLKETNALAPLYNDDDLPSFISWPEYSFWSGFIRLKNESTMTIEEKKNDSKLEKFFFTTAYHGKELSKYNDSKLEKFFFTTAYHGKELSKYVKLGNALNRWRSVVDKYATEFDATVFHEEAVFLDLINNIPIDTMQAVCGAVICIGFVCYIFLNSWFAVTIATASVLSICTGILGLISWWNVDLDPISMAAMIICVGSSCDLPAHTSFHYYLATVREGPRSDPKVKLANCLSTIAFPAVQAGISMILCVCALLFVNIYMSIVFVKMMFLCVVLCNLHALVIIPAFLVMFDYIRFGFNPKKINPSEDASIDSLPHSDSDAKEASTKNITNIPI